ncbi:MAG TPA: DUF742 domain-containing protein [Acidimicrobiales bacterium]|nr:DUF742 domain-containing protein [Acidimicrobiales bacterium]
MNDRVLADLAGDGDAPPRGGGGNLRAALPLDIPRSASHDELWDRDAGKAPPTPAPDPDTEVPVAAPDVVSEALATYASSPPEPAATPPATPAVRAQELGEDGPGRLVRPYAMTGGRTRSTGAEIPLEALVIVTNEGRQRGPGLAWEQRAIAELCASALSVAEVSAHLKVPLGVARVLVGDMAAEGLVEMSGASGNEQAPNDLNLLERVLNGLRAL